MNADAPIPGLAECVQFMRFWTDVTEVPHVTLIAIAPDLPIIVARTFAHGDLDAGSQWIAEQQTAERNVYFQPNERAPHCNHKPAKADMVAALCRFADVDPLDKQFPLADERNRLAQLADFLTRDPEAAPTAIIDSGNGIQVLWAVTREMLPPEAVLRVEAETQAIEAALGAGGTHNIDRLLRLPGTVNYPNGTKKRLGRGVSRARLIFSAPNLYAPNGAATLSAHLTVTLADTGLIRPRPVKLDRGTSTATTDADWAPLAGELKAAGADQVSRLDHLPLNVQARLNRALARRERLADRWAGLVDDLRKVGRDDTRSGADFSLAAMLKAAGISHLETGLILCAFPHGKANNDEWPNADVRLRHVARCVLHSHEPEAARADADAEPAELPSGFRMTGNGLFFVPEPTEKNPDPSSVFVAGQFQIVGQTRSDVGEDWGLLLSWCDRDSRAHRWAIPLRLIHRHGNEIAEELESAGLSCGSDENAHRLLKRFLSMVKITRRLRCVSRTGWHDGGTAPVFVLPGGEAFGRDAADVILQADRASADAAFRAAGTMPSLAGQGGSACGGE